MEITVRRARRSDPDAPLLALFHDDGGDAVGMVEIGRRLWPGAPASCLRGCYPHGAAWRHLSDPASRPADLGFEGRVLDRMAEAVSAAAKREPPLVEVIGFGCGGGADAVLGLLCCHPALFAGAVLCRPIRRWLEGSVDEIASGNGIEVLIVMDTAHSVASRVAAEMLSLSGHSVSLALATPEEEIEVSRAWICRELRGDCGNEQ